MSVFEDADKICGFSDVLAQATYPPKGQISIPGNPEGENYGLAKRQDSSTTIADSPQPSGTTIADSPQTSSSGNPPICTEISSVPVGPVQVVHKPLPQPSQKY